MKSLLDLCIIGTIRVCNKKALSVCMMRMAFTYIPSTMQQEHLSSFTYRAMDSIYQTQMIPLDLLTAIHTYKYEKYNRLNLHIQTNITMACKMFI